VEVFCGGKFSEQGEDVRGGCRRGIRRDSGMVREEEWSERKVEWGASERKRERRRERETASLGTSTEIL